MTDVQDTTTSEEKRASKLSNRWHIDANGEEVDNPMEATGALYRYLEESDKPTISAQVDELIETGHKDIVIALFGAGLYTIAGNVANRIRNGQVKDDGPQTVGEALKSWWDNLLAGNWTTPRGDVEAGVGLLAEAMLRAKNKVDGGKLADGSERTLESVTAFLKTQTKDQKKAWRKAVGEEIAEIQLERKRKDKVDATKTLADAQF